MICFRRFFIVLLVASLLGAASLYGLTPEEKAALPELSRESLIQIILTYDQSLNEIESSYDEREKALSLRELALTEEEKALKQTEITLQQKESELVENEAHWKLRENLLATSYELIGMSNKEAYWRGFRHGSAFGGTVSGVGIYFLKK